MGLGNNEKKVRVWTGVYSGELFSLLCLTSAILIASRNRNRCCFVIYTRLSKFVYNNKLVNYVDAKIWEAKAFGDLAKICFDKRRVVQHFPNQRGKSQKTPRALIPKIIDFCMHHQNNKANTQSHSCCKLIFDDSKVKIKITHFCLHVLERVIYGQKTKEKKSKSRVLALNIMKI